MVQTHTQLTPSGIAISCTQRALDFSERARRNHLSALARAIDRAPGVLLASGYEYPGRYRRYDIGFVDPPLCLTGRGARFTLEALNARGSVLLPALAAVLRANVDIASLLVCTEDKLVGEVRAARTTLAPEEHRTRRPGLISVVRALRDGLSVSGEDPLGLYGAFGYDLVFQFEELQQRMPRDPARKDLVLYLPDRLLVIDHQRALARYVDYEFEFAGRRTDALPRSNMLAAPRTGGELKGCAVTAGAGAGDGELAVSSDYAHGEFERAVERAREAFACGDLFEVTLSQCFSAPCTAAPSEVFEQLCADNPAPYGFLVNLGNDGHLIGASPEMFVRVQGTRVETCPIAGTIARGADPLADAEQILTLLSSSKDAAELTMCTDVDRNDKARICEPGSVRVLGRRQIEMYSCLIHTVDHLEGQLRPEFDALDALVSHGWAVTVTGAPKPDAMQFIEQHERSPRDYYGGAVGVVGLDGSLNTGLSLRMMHVRAGEAHIRAGATLLHASDPAAEAAECRLKASALCDALSRAGRASAGLAARPLAVSSGESAPHVVLIDHRDSFVHTLGDYLRQAGARVTTLRAGFDPAQLEHYSPQVVLLSPGPGRPQDFGLSTVLDYCAQRHLPVFGVCLGMQAMVEHAGGALGVLPVPRHGCGSTIRVVESALFAGLPQPLLSVGRYHSLYAAADKLPGSLQLLAVSEEDGCAMACAHRDLPFLGVQFHPESILSAQSGAGVRLVRNALGLLTSSEFNARMATSAMATSTV